MDMLNIKSIAAGEALVYYINIVDLLSDFTASCFICCYHLLLLLLHENNELRRISCVYEVHIAMHII